jgi:hypothetical protein
VLEASLLNQKEFYAGFGGPKVSLPSLKFLPGDSLEEHFHYRKSHQILHYR